MTLCPRARLNQAASRVTLLLGPECPELLGPGYAGMLADAVAEHLAAAEALRGDTWASAEVAASLTRWGRMDAEDTLALTEQFGVTVAAHADDEQVVAVLTRMSR